MKKFGILGVVLSLFFFVTTEAPAQEFKMKVNYVAPATHPTTQILQWWAQEVEKRSNGRVDLKLYLSMELARVMESMPTLGNGAYEIGFSAPGFFPAQFPLASMPSGMMGLSSNVRQAAYYFHEAMKIPAVEAENTANNVHFLYTNPSSPYLPLSKKPVTKLSDLKGTKVRTFGPYFAKHVQHFGATAVSIPSIEAYDAFATGAMDVFPTMATDHVVYKFSDVAKNLWDIKMGSLPWAVMYMNLDVWKGLPKDIQDVFTQVSAEAPEFGAGMWAKREQEELEKLKAQGVTIHPASQADQEAWNAYTGVLLDEWAANMEKAGKGDAARRMIALRDEIRAKYPD